MRVYAVNSRGISVSCKWFYQFQSFRRFDYLEFPQSSYSRMVMVGSVVVSIIPESCQYHIDFPLHLVPKGLIHILTPHWANDLLFVVPAMTASVVPLQRQRFHLCTVDSNPSAFWTTHIQILWGNMGNEKRNTMEIADSSHIPCENM